MTYEATVLIASILIGALFWMVVIVPAQAWFAGRIERRNFSRHDERYTAERKQEKGK